MLSGIRILKTAITFATMQGWLRYIEPLAKWMHPYK